MVTTLGANRAKARKELVEKLSDWIHAAGAWVCSVPGANELRIEALSTSDLPQRLIDAGHSLQSAGSNERLVNSTVSEVKNAKGEVTLKTFGGGIRFVNVWLLRLT